MGKATPVVCIFGATNVKLSGAPCPDFESNRLDCHCFLNDDNLQKVLAKHRPVVVVSFGKEEDFPNLMRSPLSLRKRWLNFPSTNDLPAVGVAVFSCYIQSCMPTVLDEPLISVFTPAYKTGKKIRRPFRSLQNQTYSNWEWVIVDDSDDDGETFKMLEGIAAEDSRVRLYKEHRHAGSIGRVKKTAASLGRGEFLVELDHDDELTPRALELVVKAYQAHPECGFVYTDFAECFEDGSPVTYGQNTGLKPPNTDWGFGYGSYRFENYNGMKFAVVNAPNINAKTIRHIVAAPNHIRSWRKSTYVEIGGHNDLVHVADDYEIMVRTFLNTRMCRVPQLGYIQYRNFEGGNTHRHWNKEIQRLVRHFSYLYDRNIHDRLLDLGVSDWVWQKGEFTFDRMARMRNEPSESHCTVLYGGDI
jgi:glycosyltransferase involved in cell wall biosynthesis